MNFRRPIHRFTDGEQPADWHVCTLYDFERSHYGQKQIAYLHKRRINARMYCTSGMVMCAYVFRNTRRVGKLLKRIAARQAAKIGGSPNLRL